MKREEISVAGKRQEKRKRRNKIRRTKTEKKMKTGTPTTLILGRTGITETNPAAVVHHGLSGVEVLRLAVADRMISGRTRSGKKTRKILKVDEAGEAVVEPGDHEVEWG